MEGDVHECKDLKYDMVCGVNLFDLVSLTFREKDPIN